MEFEFSPQCGYFLDLGLNADKCVVMRFGGGHRRGNTNQFCYHLEGNPLSFVHSQRSGCAG